MKKNLIVLTVIMLVFFGCATGDWNKAKQINTAEAYEQFVREHPKSDYRFEANSKLLSIYLKGWHEAKRKNTISAYEEYLRVYPRTKYAHLAREKITELEMKDRWDSAKANDTIEAYEDFLKRYPDSQHGNYIKKRITEIRTHIRLWEEAKAKDTIADYEAFLYKFPSRYLAELAKARMTELQQKEWQKVLDKDTKEAYEEFLKRSPRSPYIARAKERLEEIHLSVWHEVRREHKIREYERFIMEYPKSRYAQEAREMLAVLYGLSNKEIKVIAQRQEKEIAQPLELDIISKLIMSGASFLDSNANWTDRENGRLVYDLLKKCDASTLTSSLSRVIVVSINRLRVLFLAVKLGIHGSEKVLNELLEEYGDKSMAEDYLNSGSSKLYDGAAEWVRRRGGYIMPGPGSHRAGWGKF